MVRAVSLNFRWFPIAFYCCLFMKLNFHKRWKSVLGWQLWTNRERIQLNKTYWQNRKTYWQNRKIISKQPIVRNVKYFLYIMISLFSFSNVFMSIPLIISVVCYFAKKRIRPQIGTCISGTYNWFHSFAVCKVSE